MSQTGTPSKKFLPSVQDAFFSQCNRWFKSFLIRNNLVLRRVTSAGRELPKKTKASIAIFLENVCYRSIKKILI